jgi:hypothetical protein
LVMYQVGPPLHYDECQEVQAKILRGTTSDDQITSLEFSFIANINIPCGGRVSGVGSTPDSCPEASTP